MMFKQERPKFTYMASKSEFEEFRHEDGSWVYDRKLEVELLPWNLGYYMNLNVFDFRSSLERGNQQKLIFYKSIYDNKEMVENYHDKNILAALATNQIRGDYAENLIYSLVIKYGQDVFAEYFPLLYKFWKDNNVI